MEVNGYNVENEFTYEETLALIRACQRLTSGFLPIQMDWKSVASYLRRQGIDKSSDQLRKKWGNLMSRYRKYRRKGRTNIKYKYFDAMEELFGDQDLGETYTRSTKKDGNSEENSRDLDCHNAKRTTRPKNSKKIDNMERPLENQYVEHRNQDVDPSLFLSVQTSSDDNRSIQSSNQNATTTQKKRTSREEYYAAKKIFIENENRRREANIESKIRCRIEKNQILREILQALLVQKNENSVTVNV